jgi:ferritin
MLSKAMQDAINQQVRNEFSSAYVYLAMSAYCEERNLPGCAHWLRVQAREEVGHAMRLFDYIHSRGGQVALGPIEQPPAKFKSVLEVFQRALEHERKISGMIHQLYEMALKEGDYATQAMVQWFITEQVEEEQSAVQIVEQLKLVGEEGPALLMMDRQLAARPSGE